MDKRIREFIWYHINGDGDCNGQVLKAYADMKGLSEQDKFDLTYFYSITYCCASSIFLLNHRDEIHEDTLSFAEKYKNILVFQSDRKYVRMRDNFYRVLITWQKALYCCAKEYGGRVVVRGTVNTREAIKTAEKWYFFSRFSAYLFIETYCDIFGYGATRESGLNYEGDNMTFAGGLFYVFGMDTDAEYVQKHHRLPTDTATFERLISALQNRVIEAGGDDNLTKLETSLCAYEKMFKGTRYNGYYADRMLEEVMKMIRNPETRSACEDVLTARAIAIPQKYLGETNGWNGIRKELKKHYQRQGNINQ